jgi:hypothetical protein
MRQEYTKYHPGDGRSVESVAVPTGKTGDGRNRPLGPLSQFPECHRDMKQETRNNPQTISTTFIWASVGGDLDRIICRFGESTNKQRGVGDWHHGV